MSTGLTIGTLSGRLDIDADPFAKGIDRAMRDAERNAGKRMEKLGKDMTRNVTLPLAGIGIASVKMAVDFDTAFSRMVGLAGVAASEVDGLKAQVMDLAGETTVAPQELANALYFAASAGLDAAGAMAAVEVAARASAVGMGSTEQIVGLVASAVESYGKENINAARATDILTAAVRAGRADPEELAGTLGRVLPVAAQLGVEFEEVGGAVAFLSNVFGDTNRTVTALSGLLVKLVSPTQAGREALTEMGTSVEELQAAIDADGLMGALELLREKGFAGNQQALRALFDDIEGYQAALALLNDRSGTLTATMDEVSGSAGALDEAFVNFTETAGFRLKQALVDMQTSLITIGNVLIPLVGHLASFASTLLQLFDGLPGPMQTALVALGGLVAATGPALMVAGRMQTLWNGLNKALAGTGKFAGMGAVGVGRMQTALKAGGIVGATVALGFLAGELTKMRINAQDAMVASNNYTEALGEQDRQALRGLESMGQFDSLVRDTAASNAEAALRLLDQAEAAGVSADKIAELRGEIEQKREADAQAAVDQETNAAAIDEATNSIDGQTDSIEENIDAVQALSEALAAQLDPFFNMQDAALRLQEAQAAAAAAAKEHDAGSEEAAAANRDAVRAAADYQGAILRLKESVEAGDTSIDASIATIRAWEAQGVLTKEQADEAALSIALLGQKADETDGKDVLIDTHAVGVAEAIAALGRLDEAARAASRPVILNASIRAREQYGAATGGVVGKSLGPPQPSDTLPVWLTPGEGVLTSEAMTRLGKAGLDALNSGDMRPMVGAHMTAGGSSSAGGQIPAINLPPMPAQDIRVLLDPSGASRHLKALIREMVRVDGGGDVQKALGQGS